jgi:hypothetical protein
MHVAQQGSLVRNTLQPHILQIRRPQRAALACWYMGFDLGVGNTEHSASRSDMGEGSQVIQVGKENSDQDDRR